LSGRGDAYSGTEGLSTDNAIAFHSWQAEKFIGAPIDYMFAGIMPSKDEAIGIAKVMEQLEKPYIISLMINKAGTLLDGTTINNAIEAIDNATNIKPLCYMTNCIHPNILKEALLKPFNNTDIVKKRFYGIQANAAYFDPKNLDYSNELKTTTAAELTNHLEALHNVFPLKIIGGCCGTDDTHIEELAKRFNSILPRQ